MSGTTLWRIEHEGGWAELQLWDNGRITSLYELSVYDGDGPASLINLSLEQAKALGAALPTDLDGRIAAAKAVVESGLPRVRRRPSTGESDSGFPAR